MNTKVFSCSHDGEINRKRFDLYDEYWIIGDQNTLTILLDINFLFLKFHDVTPFD